MTFLAILVAATFLPLALLTHWTLGMKPGGGPQGGEVIFLGWLMVALWLSAASVFSAVRTVQGSAAFRYLATPALVLVGMVLFFWLVFYLLNHSSLAEVPRARGLTEIWTAAALVSALIVANVVLIRRSAGRA